MIDNKNRLIKVNTNSAYNIHIGKNICFSELLIQEILFLKQRGIERIIIIVDQNIAFYFSKIQDFISDKVNVTIDFVTIKISESLKNRETKNKIEDKLFELGANRYTVLIAIGGGVLLDTVGFVAATFNRGIPVVYIATTLLAMVDAAVGGKTGINTEYGKNLIGAFKQPDAVFLDINVLNSLSEHDYLSALAEVIKIAIIFDTNLFEFLVNNQDKILNKDLACLNYLIHTSVDLKRKIVEQDEKELNLRQLLNFGHTFGHAIEKLEDYKIAHGYAVALGIWLEVKLAHKLNILSQVDYQQIINLLMSYYKGKIPISNQSIDAHKLYEILLYDKKTKNKQPYFVLVDKIGSYYAKDQHCSHPVNKDLIMEVASFFNSNCAFFTNGKNYE